MTTKVLMDVEEYLRTSFDGSDCDYIDGEIVERNTGEIPHADVQGNLYSLLKQLRTQLGIRVLPEIRIQIHPRRYRVADVAIWLSDDIGTGIPTIAPFLVIEVLSPADRMVRMLPRIQDYLSALNGSGWSIQPNVARSSTRRRVHRARSATYCAPRIRKSRFLWGMPSTWTPDDLPR